MPKNRLQLPLFMNTLWSKTIRVFFAVLGSIALTPVIFYTRVGTRLRAGLRRGLIAAVALLVIGSIAGQISQPAPVTAATSSNLNFQARLELANGSIAPDGNYNIEFKLYNATTAGTALWTESRLNNVGQGVRVVNGYVTVNLGSVTPFPSTIAWDQELYITMNVGGTSTGVPTYDGEMSPRLKLTSVPYAFQANSARQLQTVVAGNTGTLSFAPLTASRTIELPNAAGTVCLQFSTDCGFASNAGSNSYIQNGVTLQTNANFNFQSSSITAISGAIRALTGQTADLFRFSDAAGTTLSGINASGRFYNQSGAFTGTLAQGPLAANTTYNLIDPGVASVDFCLSTGNCAGAGSGVTSAAGGTVNYLAKFSDTRDITSSMLFDNGSFVGVNTTVNNGKLSVVSNSATQSGLYIGAAASATTPAFVVQGGATPGVGGDLIALKNSAGTLLSGFDANGNLFFRNGFNGTLAQSPLAQNTTYRLTDPAQGTVDICLSTGNCAGAGSGVTSLGGTVNRIAKFNAARDISDSMLFDDGTFVGLNTVTNSGLLSLVGLTAAQSTLYAQGAGSATSPVAVIRSGATPGLGADLLQLQNATGVILAKVDAAGNLSAVNGLFSGDVTQTGTGTLSTGTGAISLNGATSVTGTNTLTVGTGATSLGGTLTVTGPATFNGGLTAVGSTLINTTGTAGTAIGTDSGTFSLSSTGLDVSAAGALSGITGYAQTSGNFAQSGTGSFSTGSGNVTLNGPATAMSSLTVRGAAGLTLGVPVSTAGVLSFANTTNTNLSIIRSLAPTGAGNATFNLPSLPAGTITDICTATGNCAGAGNSVTSEAGGTVNYLAKFTNTRDIGNSSIYNDGSFVGVNTTVNSGLLSLVGTGSSQSTLFAQGAASAIVPVATIRSGATPGVGGDLLQLQNSTGGVVAKFDSTGNLTAVAANFSGNVSQTGAGTFSTGSGAVSLNGNTSVTGANTFTVGTGASSLGGTLAVSGTTTLGGTLAVSGASTFNGNVGITGASTLTVGTGATSLGGTLAVSGATTISGALTVNGGITNTGSYSQTGTGTFSTGTGAVSLNSATTISSTLAVQGTGGITVGVAGTTSGRISYANNLNTNLAILEFGAPSGIGGNATYTVPSIAGGTSDTFCLRTANNCDVVTSTSEVFIRNQTTQQTSGNFNIQARAASVAAVIQGASGQDIIRLVNSVGATVARIDTNGNLTAVDGNFSGNIAQTGTGTFSTGTGGVTLNGNTSVSGANTLTVGTGATSLGGTLGVTGLSTLNGGANITGTTNINTTGLAATAIGNTGAAFSLASTGLNVTSAGALSGITGYAQASGNFAISGTGTFSTGTGAISLNGATSITGTNTLSVGTGATTLGGTLGVAGLATFNGGILNTGNYNQTGTGTFSTGTGAVSLNGNTTVTGLNTFSVGTGATSLGGTLTVTGATALNGGATVNNGATINGGATISGATSINTTGTANTAIGNATGTFSLLSAGLNVTAAGALSGITGYSQTGGNFGITGTGTFSTGTGAISLNGATSITGTNTLSVGTGATTLGGTLGVTGLTTLNGGLTATGATNINTTGLASTAIGNATGSFTLESSGLDVSAAGALSGITTISMSGAISAATTVNTINGLIINGGALSGITGYSQTSGNFSQTGTGTFSTGTGAVSINGSASVTGANTFSVGTGATSLGGTLAVTGSSTFTGLLTANGGITMGGNFLQTGTGTFGTGTGAVSLNGATTVSSTLAVQGAGGLTVGVAGTTNGSISYANNLNTNLGIIQVGAPSGIGNATYTVPSIAGGTSDTFCLRTANNCDLVTSASEVFIRNQTTQQTSGNFNIQARATTVAAVIQGASGQDIIRLVNSLGATVARVDGSGNLTAVGANFSGNISQTGATTFTTGTGGVTLNGNTSVSGANTLTVGTGATSLGGTLTVAGATTFNGGVSVTGTNTLTVGTGAVSFGGTLAVTGTSTFTGAATFNGGITDTGNFSQTGVGTFSTGTGAVSLNGATSVTGANTLTVGTGATTLGGTLDVTGLTTLNGGATVTGATNINTVGTANTSIGNSTGTFTLQSAGLDVDATGALSGITTINMSGAISAATTVNTINGLIINGGSLSGITGYNQTSGNFAIAGAGTFSTGTGTVTLNGATTANSTLAVRGAGGVTIGVGGLGGVAGSLNFANTTNTNLTTIQAAAPTGLGNATITVPGIAGGTSDTFCLRTANNCDVVTSTSEVFVRNQTTQQTSGNFNIQARATTVAAVIQGAAGQDIIRLVNSAGVTVASVDGSGNLTAVAANFSGNITQTGATTLSTGTGGVTLNGNTSVSGTNTLTVGTGATSLGGTLTVTGAATLNSTLAVGGTSTFTGGATFNGGITNTGSYNQTGTGTFGTGTGAVSLNGATSVTGTNTFTVGTGATSLGGTLGVTGATSLSSTLGVTGLTTLNGGATINGATSITGATTINTTGTATTTIGNAGAAFSLASSGLNITSAGALSGITTVNMSGAISAATSVNTINGLIINGGSLSGITGYNQTSGNFAIAGAGTFSTGTGTVSLNGATTVSSTLAVRGAGGVTIGVSGLGGVTGSLNLANTTNTNLATIQAAAPTGTGNATITVPSIAGGTSDTFCLRTANNCDVITSTSENFIRNQTTQQTSGNFNIQARATSVAAVIQGASGQDIIRLVNSLGATVASIDGSGNLTAVGGNFSGNVSQTGATTFSTGTGAVSLNGATSVTGTNTLTVGTGATSLGGTLAVTGASTLTGLLTTNGGINNTGNYNQTGTGTFSTGTGTVSLNGATSVTGTNTLTVGTGATSLGGTLGVTGATSLSSTLAVTGASTFNGNVSITGANTLTTGTGVVTLGSLSTGIVQSSATGVLSSGTIERNSSNFTGTLTVPNGGTGATTFASNGILYGNGTGAILATASAVDSVLVTGIGGVPTLSQTLPSAVQGNITRTGILTAGSIASGFGTISTGNTIATTATVQGGTVTSTGALNGQTLSIGTIVSPATTAPFTVNATGAITAATGITTTGNVSQTGAGTFSTGTGAVSLNGNTSITGANTFTVGTGATSLGGTLTSTGLATLNGGLNVLGATTINTTGTASTTIGNTLAGFSLQSTGLNVTTAGALSGISGYSQTSGNFSQTGAGTFGTGTGNVSLNGNTSITGANTLTVGTGTTSLGGALTVTGATTMNSTLAVRGAGGVTIGVGGLGGVAGSLSFANTTNTNLTTIQTAAPTGTGTATITVPSIAGGTSDTFCLRTANNCDQVTSDSGAFIRNQTTQQTTANFNIQASATTVAAVIQGASGQDIIRLVGSAGTTVASIDANGNLTAVGGNFSGNITQTGATTFSTGTGTISLNGATSVTGANTLTVGTGATSLGGTLTVTGLATMNGGATVNGATSITGATTINTTGAAATTIGNATAAFSLASTGLTVTSAGALSGITGYAQASGNFTQSGAGTFSTATGTVSLNGATSVTGANTFNVGTGASTLGGSLAVAGLSTFNSLATFNAGARITTGSTFTNASSTLLSSKAIAGTVTGGPIGTAADTVDVATTFDVNQPAGGKTLSLPAPTNTAAGRLVYVNNVGGTVAFTMHGTNIKPNTSASFIWNGLEWVNPALSASGVTTVGLIDSVPKSANGAVIDLTNIYLQTADATNVGLVSAAAQTIGGAKTFNSLLTAGAGLTANNGAVSLTGNAASSFTTSAGALTLTSAAAATWSTSTGNLTLQAGSGIVSLGTSTTLTANGALSVTSGGATTMSIDAGGAASLNLGGTNANAVSISRTGVATTINGSLAVTQAATFNGNVSVAGAATLTVGTGATTLGGTLGVTGAATLSSTLNVRGAGGVTLGVAGVGGTAGVLQFANTTNTNLSILNAIAPTGTGNATYSLPTLVGGAAAEICLDTGNCAGAGGAITGAGTTNYVARFDSNASINASTLLYDDTTFIGVGTTVSNATLSVLGAAATKPAFMAQATASATTPVAVIKGGATPGAGGDLLQLQNSAGAVLAKVDATGNLSAVNGSFTGTLTVTGTGTFNGASTFNADVSVAGASKLTVATGATTLGGTLTVTGLATLNGGATVSGATSITGATTINTTGTGNTAIGNATGTFALESAGLDVTTAGALSGITTINMSGAITAATTVNTINGLIINGGSLSGITGYNQTSGNFAQSGGGTFSTGTGNVSLNGATTISSTLAVRGAGGITVGVAGVGGTNGTLNLANTTNTNLTSIQSLAPTGTGNAILNFPSIAGGSTDEVCLKISGNCAGSGGGVTTAGGNQNFVTKFSNSGATQIGNSSIYDDGLFVGINTTTNSGAFSVQGTSATQPTIFAQAAASATTPVAVVKGGATPGLGADLMQFQNSLGVVLAKVDASGNITSVNSTVTGNFSQTGAGTFSTGTGTVTLNGATSVSGANTFNVGTGATTLGGALTVAGLTTLNGGVNVTGATNINTTGTAATTIGNATAAFSLASTGLNVTSAGAVSGATTITASGAITAATTVNTINGLIINGGALSGITGYSQASGNFSQTGAGTFGTGTGAVSLNGATTVGSTLAVSGTTTLGGALTVNAASTFNGSVGISGTNTLTTGTGAVTFGSLGAGLVQSSAAGLLSSSAVDRNSATFFSGTLNVANGGTGAVTLTSNGILYGNGTGAVQATAAAADSILATNGTSVPALTQTLPGAVQSNITATGALASGSITTGFGSISTTNTIATSGSLQGGTLSIGTITAPATTAPFTVNAAGAITAATGITTSGNFLQSGTGTFGTGTGAVSLNGATTVSTTLNVQGAGGLTLGVSGIGGANGSLKFANTTNTNLTILNALAASGTGNASVNIPTVAGGSTDELCLKTLGNCAGAGNGVTAVGGIENYISKFTNAGGTQIGSSSLYNDGNFVGVGTTTNSGFVSIAGSSATQVTLFAQAAASATTPVAVIKGGATPGIGGDLLQLQNSVGTVVAKIDATGNLTAVNANISGNFTQTGAGTFSTGTGAVSLNGATTAGSTLAVTGATTLTGTLTANGASTFNADVSVAGGSKLTVGTGATSLGGTLTVTGSSTFNGATSVSGTNTFTTGTGAVTIGSLGAGLVQSSATGLLSSGAVDRNAAAFFTGTLNVANGGTGAATFASNGVLYGNGTGAIQATTAAADSILATNATSVPGLTQTLPVAVQGNITRTGALAAGSIVSGFGTITTANNITTSAVVQGGTVTSTGSVNGQSLNIGTIVSPATTAPFTVNATGAITAATGITTSGNFAQTGAGTFGTGTGAVSLNGATSVTGSNTFSVGTGTSTFGGAVNVQSASGLTLGVAGIGGTTGTLKFANTTNTNLGVLQIAAPTGTGNATITFPSVAGGSSDTVCLKLAGNCAGALSANGGQANYVARFTSPTELGIGVLYDNGSFAGVNTTTNNGTLSIQSSGATTAAVFAQGAASATSPVAVIRGGATPGIGGDLLQLQNSIGTVVAKIDASGNLTAGTGTFSGLVTANAGLTVITGQNLTVNGDVLTDLTGSGLTVATGALTVDDTSATGFFRNGGNSFGQAAVIGTNDANTLSLRTNGINRVTINSSGQVNIGGAGSAKLSVGGQGTAPALRLNASATQSANLAELQDSAGNINAAFSALGNQLTLGRIATTGTVQGGSIVLADGTSSGFGASLNTAALTAARTISLPNADGTICLQASASCGFAATTGGTGYIQNQSASAQTANFFIQSAAIGSTTALIKGITSQTADLLQLQNSLGTVVAKIDATGNLSAVNANISGNFSQTGAGTFSTGTGAVNLNGPSIVSSTLAVQGAGGLTLGVAGVGGATGSLKFANTTNTNLGVLQIAAPTGVGNATYTVPSIAGGTTDEFCLRTAGNCAGSVTATGGQANYVARFTSASNLGIGILYDNGSFAGVNTTTNSGTLSIQSSGAASTAVFAQGAATSTVPVAIIKGGATPTATADLLQLQNSAGATVAKFDASGNLTAGSIDISGNFAQSGAGSFSTGTGAVNLNGATTIAGNTSITGTSTLTVGTGAVTFGSLGAGLVQSNASGLLSSGAVDRNSATYFNGTLTVANGGTGATTLTSNGVLYGNGTGTVQATTSLANAILRTGVGGIPELSQTLPLAVQGNITNVGALTAGSITTGFGTISTANNITTSAIVQGGTVTSTGALNGQSLSINAGTFAVSSAGAITAATGIATTGNFSQTGAGTFSTGTGNVFLNGPSTVSSTLAVQGAGGLTLGVAGVGGTAGALNFANTTNTNLSVLQIAAPSGVGNATYTVPSIAGGTSDTFCLQTVNNCGGVSATGGQANYVARFTGATTLGIGVLYDNGSFAGVNTTTNSGTLSIQSSGAAQAAVFAQGAASATAPVAVIKGGATPTATADLLQLQNSAGAVLAKVDNAGNIMGAGFDTTAATTLNIGTTNATSIALRKNTAVTGSLSVSNGLTVSAGASSFAGNVDITGATSNLTVGAGATSLGGTLAVTGSSTFTGLATFNGGVAVANNSNLTQTGTGSFSTGTGAVNLNGATTIGSTLNVSGGTVTVGSTGQFTISTTGNVATSGSILGSSFDINAAGALNIGTTNATSIGLMKNTSVTGTLAFSVLGTADTQTFLCRNTLNQVATCTGQFALESDTTNFVRNQTTQQINTNFNIQARTASVAAVIQGAASNDIIRLVSSAGTTVASVDATGNLTAVGGTFSGAINANGGVFLGANQNLSLPTGTGTITQSYSNNSGSADTRTVNNSGTSGINVVNGITVNPTGAGNTTGTNTTNAINLGNVAAATNNAFYAFKVGTGYTDILNYNGTSVINGLGQFNLAQAFGTLGVANGGTGANTLASNGILYGNGTSAVQATAAAANSILATNGTNVPALTQTLPLVVQGNITNVGALTAGSISTGFGAISTTNSISTSTSIQGAIVNATTGFRVNGAAPTGNFLKSNGTEFVAGTISGTDITGTLFSVAASAGTTQNVAGGGTVSFLKGASNNLTTIASATNTITIDIVNNPTFTGAVSAGSLTVGSTGQFQVGATGNTTTSGTISQTFLNAGTGTTSATSIAATNTNTTLGATTVNGTSISLTGTSNVAGGTPNTLNGINLNNVTPVAGNSFNGIVIGSGYNAALTVNGSQIISGAGILQNNAFSTGTSYSNITQIGTITAGVWNASTVTAAYGGTGSSAIPTNGQILIGNGTGYTAANLTTGATSGLTQTVGAGSLGLAVNFGSGAGQVASGSGTITCTAGTGNLTGGGNSFTVGAGGTCGTVNTVANPSFNSITIANATNTNTALLIQNAGGFNSLTFDTVNGALRVWDSSVVGTPTNYASVSYANNAAVFAASSGVTQLGATSGNVSVPLTGASDSFLYTKTYGAGSAYATNEFTIQRIVTGGTNALTGSVLKVENRSSGSADSASVLYVNQNNTGATGFVVQVQSGATSDLLTLDVAGNLNIKNGYQVNGNAGQTGVCAAGASFVATSVIGGIVTAGACSTGGAAGSLQSSYDNGNSITTSATAKNILFKAGTGFDSNNLFQIQNSASLNILTTDTLNRIVQVGSATVDGTQVNLALDQSSVADSGTCNTTTNPNGAMYYSTVSHSIRACTNGVFNDLVSTAALGILLFGVVPDSGTVNQGDLPSLATAGVSGPCKVSWVSASSVSVAACTAYSAGKKVVIPTTTIATSAMNTTTALWGHVCLTGTNGQPALTTSASEITGLPAFSPNAPVLCLADIKNSTATAATIDDIYDVRTFTNSQKEFATISTTAAGLGQIVAASGSNMTQAPATTLNPRNAGIVVATNGGTSTTTPNAIIVVAGPAYAKATAGTAGDFVQNGAAAGYSTTVTTLPTAVSGILGVSRTTFNTACTTAASCTSSIYLNVNIK